VPRSPENCSLVLQTSSGLVKKVDVAGPSPEQSMDSSTGSGAGEASAFVDMFRERTQKPSSHQLSLNMSVGIL
jgi:hypothetical protein